MTGRDPEDDRRYLESMLGRELPGGCMDCTGNAEVRQERDGRHRLHIHHDPGCPAAAGVVPWAPVRPDEP